MRELNVSHCFNKEDERIQMYTSSSGCVALTAVFQIKSSVYKQLRSFIPARGLNEHKEAITLNSCCRKLAENLM